jgi:hypothetical protein
MDHNRHSASPGSGYNEAVEEAFVLLARLKTVHEELLEALSGLEALLGPEAPNPQILADVRQHLRQCSVERTRLLEDTIYPLLAKTASKTEQKTIEALRADAARFRPISDTHVAMWTSDRIMRTWPKYCSASASMRGSMRRRIQTEQEALYPMLEARTMSAPD